MTAPVSPQSVVERVLSEHDWRETGLTIGGHVSRRLCRCHLEFSATEYRAHVAAEVVAALAEAGLLATPSELPDPAKFEVESSRRPSLGVNGSTFNRSLGNGGAACGWSR